MQKTITIEKNYPYSRDEVWNALTDVESLGEWLMPGNFEPRVGHAFQFHFGEGKEAGTVDCKVLEVKRPIKLSYSWKGWGADTVVTWLLEASNGGTKLRLEHSGFDSEKDEQIFNGLSGGWQKKLDELLPQSVEKRQKVAA